MMARMYQVKRYFRSEFVPIRNLQYHVQVWGEPSPDKIPLVMVHGWMDVAASYQFVVDALSHDHYVIAPDWRGYGKTASGGVDNFWFPDYLADLDFLLDHYAPDQQVNLVGHSMGGNVVMLYAGVRPERIRRLVNLEGFGMPATTPDQAPARYASWMDELKQLHRGELALKAYDSAAGVARRLMKTNPRLRPDKATWLAQRSAAAQAQGLKLLMPADLTALPGRGVQATVDGHHLLLGSLRWLQQEGLDPALWASDVRTLQAQGATLSALAERTATGMQGLLLLAFGDEPKAGAAQALTALRQRGLKLVMISGENQAAAEAMARRLGLRPEDGEVRADVLPGDKAGQVQKLREGGRIVAMVGDGVNDAPALAAADVGMAMGNGTDVAMHAAGITLMRGDPRLVAAALDISGRTVAKIRQNLFWAFAYNVAGIPLAALGYLNPVVAGAAMALSSVSVMSNALLLKRWKPGK